MPKVSCPFSSLTFIAQYFTTDFDHNEPLSLAESTIISKAVAKRVADFKTGRYCARQALLELINDKPEILQGNRREPLWPKGIVGSISHSNSLAGAVVAKQENVKAIGLDIEDRNGVTVEMWHLLFNAEEAEFIRGKQDDTFWATLFFSFKESFYKMQYPITGLFLGFTDIMISVQEEQLYFSQANPDNDLSAIDFNNIKTQWVAMDGKLITLCYI